MRRIIAALTIFASGVALAVWLKDTGRIGEFSLMAATTLFALVGLIVFFMDRVISFSLKDLKVELAKVETARREVEEREESVKKLSLLVAEIAGFLTAFHRRIGSDKSHRIEERWLSAKTEKLLQLAGATGNDRGNAFQWLREVKRFDDLPDERKSNAEWEALWDRVDAGIGEDQT